VRAATETFGRAVRMDPLSADAHYLLGFAAVRTGEFERAGRAWEMFMRLSPEGETRQLVAHALGALRALTQIVDRSTTR
jgi:cytochrome c-type biogenesis protein CcmH/NrfG